ncbi:hypothetical protein J5N97_006543 [Dioscorea zingiberensis]|uniref:Uncharacterized protein n=1 Tax=Dioscorea zingiberensis TaxID=325984 RepID=A0A9D5HU45_9LILI|nr:hypothetical protein J5N97_006543 [Dioscorea zingiberensis]
MRTLLSILTLFSFSILLQTPTFAATKPYIVYLGGHTSDTREDAAEDFHNEILGSILKDKEKAKAAIYYYYKYHINAFAANLEEEEANAVSKHPRVVSVFPSKTRTLHTTRSWQFMGLENPGGEVPQTSLWKRSNFGEDVIIANIDTAGNLEDFSFYVINIAPWVTTVGASSIDRDFPSYLTFNNITIKGQSLSSVALAGKKDYPMITGKDAKAPNAAVESAADCTRGSLDPEKVKGKIVVCIKNITRGSLKGEAVKEAGGAGLVIVNIDTEFDDNENYASLHVIPATHITVADAPKLLAYLNSTKSPLGYISSPVTELNLKPSPVLAGFSLGGPNRIAAEILKPDVIAPGINILAAYSEALGPLGTDFDTRRVPYTTLSGTSMSAPHVAGIAANLKAIYPSWTPARIQSAIMTTAVVHDNDGNVIKKMSMDTATAFDYGAGHVMPNRAMDPGLVYDISKIDYLNYLCDYMESRWLTYYFINFTYNCPNERPPVYELNYPSITFPSISMNATSITRTVTNVGAPGTYKVIIFDPPGVTLKVNPMVLSFSKMEEKKMYSVTSIVRTPRPQPPDVGDLPDYTGYVFGRIIWTDGKHRVASQVVVNTHALKF